MTDAEIIRRIKASDPEGMRALLTRYGGTVRAALFNKHGQSIADEAMNEAALVIWVHASTMYVEGKGSLCGWFLRIAHNKAIDIRRGEKRQAFLKLDFDPSYDMAKCDDQPPETSDQAQKRERREKDLKAFILRLPRVQRIITLCDLANEAGVASIDEIRDALQNPTASNGSIYTNRSKARAAIRAEMIRLGYYS